MCPIGTILDLLAKKKRANFLKKLKLDNKNNKYAVARGFLAGSYIAGSPLFCPICPIRGVCTAAGTGAVKATGLALTAVPIVFEFSD